MSDQRQTSPVVRRVRRHARVRAKLSGTQSRPRLSVFRSGQHIYAQVIDDLSGRTLVSASSAKMKTTGKKLEQAKVVGEEVAKLCLASGIDSVVFDRGGYLYHGRVKALAESAREGGLKF